PRSASRRTTRAASIWPRTHPTESTDPGNREPPFRWTLAAVADDPLSAADHRPAGWTVEYAARSGRSDAHRRLAVHERRRPLHPLDARIHECSPAAARHQPAEYTGFTRQLFRPARPDRDAAGHQ